MNEKIIPISLGMVSAFAIVGEKTVLVDTGMPEHGPIILEKLAAEGIKPQDIKLIVITHGHMDHFGGAGFLREKTGARVLVHKEDASALKNGFGGFPKSLNWTGAIISMVFRTVQWLAGLFKPASARVCVEPDIIIDQECDLKEFGIEGKVVPTPGHTVGAVSVILKKGEAFVGDLIGNFLKKDVPSLPMWGNDEAQIRQSIQLVMQRGVTTVYPGHVRAYSRQEMETAFGK